MDEVLKWNDPKLNSAMKELPFMSKPSYFEFDSFTEKKQFIQKHFMRMV